MMKLTHNRRRFLKKNWLFASGAFALAITGGTVLYTLTMVPKPQAETIAVPGNPRISALGRLEPEAEILQLAPPSSLENDRLLELRIKEGDSVKAGAILAVLDSRDRLLDERQQAQAQVAIAHAKLAQVKAGAKTGEIDAQNAQVQRLQSQRQGDIQVQQEAIAKLKAQWQGDRKAQQAKINRYRAELVNAQSEYQRYQQLKAEGAIAQSLLDGKRLTVETAQQQVNEEQALLDRLDGTADRQFSESQALLDRTQRTGTEEIAEAAANLDRIAEVRPVDIQAAQAELTHATAVLKRAETALEKAYIRSPIAGQVLRINSRAGEKPGDSGIVDLAQTDRMIVIAEVYQTDIAKVKSGQPVTVTSQAFEGELQGLVYQIGQQVNPQTLTTNQPGENLDRRIIEVKVRLNSAARQKVTGLTHLQVQTLIEIDRQTTAVRLR
jgi:HlyD family secretion protein